MRPTAKERHALSTAAPGPAQLLMSATATLLLALVLAGCQSAGPTGSSTTGPSFAPTFTGASYNSGAAQGTTSASIDTSSCNKGYVGAAGTGPARMKLQVTHNSVSYNYDLPPNGAPAVYPLNMGDGNYTFTVFQNIEGSRYAQVYSTSASVELENETAPFSIPTFFCEYDETSACVAKARELTANAKNQGDALAAIYSFIVANISYDDEKAASLANATGYVPNPDNTLSERRGICFDYSSLAAAMLRSIGIPAKIVTGTVEEQNLYHAWNMVYIDGTWEAVGISVKSKTWSRLDATFDADGSSPPGKNLTYVDRYVY